MLSLQENVGSVIERAWILNNGSEFVWYELSIIRDIVKIAWDGGILNHCSNSRQTGTRIFYLLCEDKMSRYVVNLTQQLARNNEGTEEGNNKYYR